MNKKNIRFLHISDVHLGCPHYQSRERERDFFLAFESVIERFALPIHPGDLPQVDFIVLPGDLFDSRTLQPITLSRTCHIMSLLRDAGISVFASEGNHDTAQHRYRGEPNWYNYLAGEGYLHYLQDRIEEGQVVFDRWDPDEKHGGYIDLPCGVRIVGTQWYGTRAENMLPNIAQALAVLPPVPFTILLFHGGLTDYVGSSSGGADFEQFLALKPYVQYLALGHIHKFYERQHWIFNPGSLESTRISDYFEKHGCFRVTLQLPEASTEPPSFVVEHLTEYRRRPVIWLSISCDRFHHVEELEAFVRQLVQTEGMQKLQQCRDEFPRDIEFVAPICYLEFQGSLGFPFATIPIQEWEPWILEQLEGGLFRHHNRTIPRNFGGEENFFLEDGRIDRDALERKVFARLIAEDTRYQKHAQELAQWVADLKKTMTTEHIRPEEYQEFVNILQKILFSPPT